MGAFLRFIIGAEALRHLPTPKKFDHLIRRFKLALAAVIAFAIIGMAAFLLLAVYLVMAIVGSLPS